MRHADASDRTENRDSTRSSAIAGETCLAVLSAYCREFADEACSLLIPHYERVPTR